MVTVMRKMIVLVYIFVFGGGIIELASHPGGVVPARSAFLQKSSRRRRRREGQAAADRIAVSESAPEVRSVGRPIRWFPFWHIRMEGGRGRGRCAVVRSLYADRESEAQLAVKNHAPYFFPACRRLGAVTGGGRAEGVEGERAEGAGEPPGRSMERPPACSLPCPGRRRHCLSLPPFPFHRIYCIVERTDREAAAASLGTLPRLASVRLPLSLPFR